MQELKWITASIAALFFMVSFSAAGDPSICNLCDEKVDVVEWLDGAGACYQFKANCKGAAAGGEACFARTYDTFRAYTQGADAVCAIESDHDDYTTFEALKGACDVDGGQTKLELKIRTDLCPYTCEKPVDGYCI